MSIFRRPVWMDAAYARNNASARALGRSLPSYSVPIGNSRWTAPGYFLLEERYYSYPDVAYPWDPAVVRAIREFEPSAMPICIRSTWRRMNYGNPEPPFTLIRHGVARLVRDPFIPLHHFRCELPVAPCPGLFPPYGVTGRRSPNYVEVNHYDREDRPYGYDVPGQYLSFGWPFYHELYRNYENNRRWQDIAEDVLEPERDEHDRVEKHNREEGEYVEKQIARDWNEEVSSVEWKEAMYGDPEPARKSSVVVGQPEQSVPAPNLVESATT